MFSARPIVFKLGILWALAIAVAFMFANIPSSFAQEALDSENPLNLPQAPEFENPPALAILTPEQNTSIDSNQVEVKFATLNIVIAEEYAPISGRVGHLHFWLDEENPVTGNAIEHFVKDPYVFEKIPDGKHTLIAELTKSDHNSFDPPVKVSINFETAGVGMVPEKAPVYISPTQIIGGIVVVVLIIAVVLFVYSKKKSKKGSQPFF